MRGVLVLVIVLWCAAPSIAQTTDSERLAGVLTKGLNVSIVDDTGMKTDGRIDQFSEQTVHVSQSGRTVEIPVERIVRIERPDGLGNGALIGFGVGFSLVYVQRARSGPGVSCPRCWFALAVGQGVFSMGIGAAIDAAFDNTRTLYERGRPQARVSPLVGPGVRGAAVSVSW